jgi:hypothetical protein
MVTQRTDRARAFAAFVNEWWKNGPVLRIVADWAPRAKFSARRSVC